MDSSNMDSSYTAMLKEHLGVPEFFTPSDDVVSCSRDVPASGVSIQDGSAPTSAKSFVGNGKSTCIPRKAATKIPSFKSSATHTANRGKPSVGLVFAAKPKSTVCEQNTACSVPKPAFKMHADNLSESASIDRSIDDDCPSPVLAGQIQLRFEEAHSSEDKQFSPIISALKQKQELKAKGACDSRDSSGRESMHSPVLQVVDANLPPVQTRIPSHTAVRTSKASSDASEAASNVATGISFNPHENSESSTPKVFGASQRSAADAFDDALGCNEAAGIQLLTPVGPFAPEDVQAGLAEEDPSSGCKQVTTQPKLHPLFQQASATSIHVPIFHLPGTQEAKAPSQGNNVAAVADPQSPHVTITAPDLFVVEQERLSDPLPAHDPRKLLASDPSDQLIGTPPYAQFIRHLNGDEASPLRGEATLLVQQPSPVAEDSSAPDPTSQPSLSSAATPDGRNFGELLNAITAHEYHSPAPAMIAHLTGADKTKSNDAAVADGSPSDAAPAAGMGQLLNAINANEYHSPAPAAAAHLTGADMAPSDASVASGMGQLLNAISANEYHSPAPAAAANLGGAVMSTAEAAPEALRPTLKKESTPAQCTHEGPSSQLKSAQPIEKGASPQCAQDAPISQLESAEPAPAESQDAVADHVQITASDEVTMGSVEKDVSSPLDLAVVTEAALDGPKDEDVAEQSSFHTGCFHPVMTPQEDRSTPYFSPAGFEVSSASPTECEDQICPMPPMSAQQSSGDHGGSYIIANLRILQDNPSDVGAAAVAVHLSVQNSRSGTDDTVLATGPTAFGADVVHFSQSPAAHGVDAVHVSQSPTTCSQVVQSVPSYESGDLGSAISLELPAGIAPVEQPTVSPISCSFLEAGASPGDDAGTGVDRMLFSPVAFLSESEGGFSFGLSPSSACRESVASVGFGTQHLWSPVLLDNDQMSLCQSASVPEDNDRVNLLSPTKVDSPVKTMSPEPRGRASAMSNGTPVLSPAMKHVEALKTLSKKEDSLRQSFQSLEKHQDLEIHLPSELDTPQCSAMVRNLENALREGECDGGSRQEAYTQWISETGIMTILTPSGQMDAALQSMFRKAQMSDEAVQAAEHVSQMEMENNVQHNMECAALHTEQMKLAQENETLRLEKDQHEQARIQVEKHNASLMQERALLEARLLEALRKHKTYQPATPVVPSLHTPGANDPRSSISLPMTASILTPENCDKSISELIEFVKDLEKHVVIVCQRSQQQDASNGSFETTVSYLQQLDKKLHAGKVKKSKLVTDMLAHLKGRIRWAQESLPELIGEFDGAMHEVSRRSMDLSKMKQISRAALDEEHSAVGELETHLKCVGVSMRAHLHSIFEEVNRWPGHIQRLLTHKATKDDISDEAVAESQQGAVAAFEHVSGSVESSLSEVLTRAADKSALLVAHISRQISSVAADPQECPSPCAATPQAAVDAGTSPHVPGADLPAHQSSPAMSPSFAVPTGVSVSALTPPPQVRDAQDKDAQEKLIFQVNPLFSEDIHGNVSPVDLKMSSDPETECATSMPVEFSPLPGDSQCKDVKNEPSSPLVQGDCSSMAQGAAGTCSVSVQTSPVDAPETTDANDTSPESYTGCSVATRRKGGRDGATAERVQFLCNALQVKASPFMPKRRPS